MFLDLSLQVTVAQLFYSVLSKSFHFAELSLRLTFLKVIFMCWYRISARYRPLLFAAGNGEVVS